MTGPGLLDLSPGAGLVLDGAEWTIEVFHPQHGRVLLRDRDGRQMAASIRFLINHAGCRQNTTTSGSLMAADRGRQPANLDDLPPARREQVLVRLAHLLEVETGFRGGDPLRPGPGEPRPAYDPASTTVMQRRHAKIAELRAVHPDEARLLGVERVSYRTLLRWEVQRRRFGAIGCADDRWLRRSGQRPSITEPIREAIFAVHAETLHRSRISMKTRERLIHQYVRETFGPEVAVPCYETLRGVWIDWFGPGGARQRYARFAAATHPTEEHVVSTGRARSSRWTPRSCRSRSARPCSATRSRRI